jgi:hypothetical protein
MTRRSLARAPERTPLRVQGRSWDQTCSILSRPIPNSTLAERRHPNPFGPATTNCRNSKRVYPPVQGDRVLALMSRSRYVCSESSELVIPQDARSGAPTKHRHEGAKVQDARSLMSTSTCSSGRRSSCIGCPPHRRARRRVHVRGRVGVITVGLFAENAQAAQGMSLALVPFTFVSSAYVPVSSLPGGSRPSRGINRSR